MRVILVAGGAGFIGSQLCRELLSEENKIICVDNLITSDKKNIEEFLKDPNFEFVNQDITTKIQSSRLAAKRAKFKVQSLDCIFHLASPASPNKKSPRSYINYPIETLMVNSLGTYNLLELAKETSAGFVYASSSEVYGDPKVSPQEEEYFGNVNPNGVRSVYDEGKRFGEAITMAYFRKFNLDAKIVRIFNTYGPKMMVDDGRVVSNFINQAIKNEKITIYGQGKQTRSFCYVDDMVRGLKEMMFSQNSKGQVVNLGNPNEKTIMELATIIKGLTNSNSEIVFEELPQDDPKSRRPDITRAKELIGWEPKIGLEEGLNKTINYFKNL
jgi:nucleoside-diphosphate-sugar epimerase